MNNISRTAPIALIAGVAGPLGVTLAQKLLEKNIQVIGIDNFSFSNKEFLDIFVKNRAFHLISKGMEDLALDDLPEVGYAYFLIHEDIKKHEYEKAFTNFLKLVGNKKTKIVLVSSLDLYNPHIPHPNLKWAEELLVKQTKEEKLNARIVRVTNIYGPGMDLSLNDPLFEMVNLILSGGLATHQINLDVLSRAIYVDDAANLLLKVVFHGSTSSKLYDGSLLNPIKLNEIRQALLDPIWYEKSGFTPTLTPAWPSPNLVKTQNELNWSPKTPILEGLRQTVGFFNKYPELRIRESVKPKEVEAPQPTLAPIKLQKLNLTPPTPQIQPVKQIKAIKPTDFWEDQPKVSTKTKNNTQTTRPKVLPKLGGFLTLIICLAIIGYGLIYPISNVLLAVFSLKEDLNQASQLALMGNLNEAGEFVNSGTAKLSWLSQVYDDLLLLRPEGFLNSQFAVLDDLKLVLTRSVMGTDNFLTGINSLDMGLNIIKGEGEGDLNKSLLNSQTNLADAKRNFDLVYALINDSSFINNQPEILKPKLLQLKEQSLKYALEAEQLNKISLLTSQILPVGQEKNYLVVLEDNRILKPSGGIIISTLEIKVKDGRIINLISNKASDIDAKLPGGLGAPGDIKDNSGKQGLLLSNVTQIPDFVESSKWLDLIYEKETGDKIDGVVVLDLDGVKDILEESGDLKMGGSITVNSSNLDQLVSQDQGSVKTDILKELVNKIIFVKNPNWNNLIASITKGVGEKHIAIYISDPAVLNISSDFNWTPIGGFTPTNQAGGKDEYLYFYQNDQDLISNLSRTGSLNSGIDSSGSVSHNLNIAYKYDSGDKSSAKFKLTFNLPRGTKIIAVKWGDKDILKQGILLTDQNISSYNFDLEVGEKETKQLVLSYQDLLPIKFDNSGNLKYSQIIVKQLGAQDIPFNFSLSYPGNYNVVDKGELTVGQNIITSQKALSGDQNYNLVFSNK